MTGDAMESINDIISGLSAQDIENLKAAAENIFGSGENKKDSDPRGESQGAMPDLSSILGDARMMAKISSIMGMMNKRDSRAELIVALKPLLSEKRRKRADDAMQMLKLFEILPLMGQIMGGDKNER
ncbi:MAG: hypothetical protein J6R20_03380 [Clostridia bacterium]|nr:hypothetical protein [Clostridia bacterium]